MWSASDRLSLEAPARYSVFGEDFPTGDLRRGA
jgi:hypothetical protein